MIEKQALQYLKARINGFNNLGVYQKDDLQKYELLVSIAANMYILRQVHDMDICELMENIFYFCEYFYGESDQEAFLKMFRSPHGEDN